MRTIQWVNEGAAVSAGTAFAPPSGANIPRVAGVINAVFLPGQSGSTTQAVFETGVASGTSAPSAGNIAVDVSEQKFIAGDDLAASGVAMIQILEEGDVPVQT